MSSAPPPPPRPAPPSTEWFPQLRRFWLRLTDGMALEEMWEQLRTQTTSSYQMYAREAAQERPWQRPGRARRGRRAHWWDFCWAIVLKMPPARRILFLIAILIFIFWPTWSVLGVLVILGLLALEIGDRVAMKRDLEIAREIQLWLLPAEPPVVPGVELAFMNQPANTVSGDFYDAFWRGGGKLLFAVADVAGKGLPAAMLMATFQASLRTLGAGAGSLDAVVAALDGYACAHSQDGSRFTTAFVGEYDPGSRRLRYYNAGHNPPMLRRADQAVERLEAGGTPFGIRHASVYECAEVQLGAADTLVVFSDGLTDSVNPAGQDYGEARLLALIGGRGPLSARARLEQLVADCRVFRAGAPRPDDLTLLVLQVGDTAAADV